MKNFAETQHFRQWWLWLIMGMVVVITISSLWVTDSRRKPFESLVFIPLLLIVLFLYYWRLDTRLDKDGIHYRAFPIFSWRTIRWDTVQSATVNSYSFVGYGICLGFDGWVYNVTGSKELRIVKKDNQKLTIGTQKPDEVRSFLSANPTLITT